MPAAMIGRSRSCFLFTLCFFFFCNAFILTRSEVFTVGDENGWTMQVNYGSWTENHNFTVGDILEFKYTRVEHNVYEVTKEVYQSCNTTTGVLAKYQTGSDEIELKEVRKYWFICEIDGHCLGGMRLAVDVSQQQPAAGSGAGAGGEPPVSVSDNGGSSSGASNVINHTLGRYLSLFMCLILVCACVL